MNSKSAVVAGLVITLLLAVAVGGLYVFGQKKMTRESLNQFAAAKTLYETSQWTEAERMFSQIAAQYPHSDVAPECLYYSALITQTTGRYETALEKWRSLGRTKNNSRPVEADYYASCCLEALGRKEQSASGYTRVATTQHPVFASLSKCGLGRIAEADGKFEEARTRYQEAMAMATTPEARGLSEKLLGDLNLRLFLQPTEDNDKEAYLVRPGDSMVSIAIANNTTVDLLCKINGITNPASIRPSMRLLIPKTDFSIVIDKSDFKLTLYNRGKFFKSYKVGLGKHSCTPIGEFEISDKIKNPTWWSPEGPIPPGDPRNELGTRWMALKPFTPGIGLDYGIHGTIDPSTIGWESSNGCPRMYPESAEELYMLVTIGTPVEVRA